VGGQAREKNTHFRLDRFWLSNEERWVFRLKDVIGHLAQLQDEAEIEQVEGSKYLWQLSLSKPPSEALQVDFRCRTDNKRWRHARLVGSLHDETME
jgi:hypothetical protein